MDRSDQEAALRRACALERELRMLRAHAAIAAEALQALPPPGELTQPAIRLRRRRWRGWARRGGFALAALAPLGAAAAWVGLSEPEILRYPVAAERDEPPQPAVEEAVPPAPAEPVVAAPALRTRPQPVATDPALVRATAIYREGLRLYAASAEPEALASFERAIRTDPTFPDPHRALGVVLKRSGDLRGMCREFARYVELSPHARDTGRIKAEMARRAETVGACRLRG